MPATISDVAANVRKQRRRLGLSLGDVARQTSLSKSTVAGLESGDGNPTLTTVAIVADALGVSVSTLFVGRSRSPRRLVRSGDAENRGTDDEPIDAFTSSGTTQLYEIRYEDGDEFVFDGHGAGAVERVLVFEGTLLAGPLQHEETLHAGDYLAYGAGTQHRFAAVDGPARGVLIVSLPGRDWTASQVHPRPAPD